MLLTEFFIMLAGGAHGAKKYIGESRAIRDNLREEAAIQQYLQEHTDPALEAEWTEKVMDPACYDEIWERLEDYKRSGGRYSIWSPDVTTRRFWSEIGTHRPILFDRFGRPLNGPGTVIENGVVYGTWNPHQVLRLVMHTFGKQTQIEARLTVTNRLH